MKVKILRLLLLQEDPLSIREISEIVNIKYATTYQHLEELERRELIRWLRPKARSISITEKGINFLAKR